MAFETFLFFLTANYIIFHVLCYKTVVTVLTIESCMAIEYHSRKDFCVKHLSKNKYIIFM